MTEIVLTLPKRHAGQNQVIASKGRFNVLACGRRFGKTTLGLDVLVTEPKGALDGYPVAWFAPNSKLFDEVWHEAKALLRPITTRVDSQQNTITLVTGGKIDFWTLHNTDAPGIGRKYARVVIDEAAIASKLERQWPMAIRPTLTDFEGDAWFLSTPRGSNYFKQLFDRRDDGWAHWQLPTTTNPHINPDEVAAAKMELPRLVYEQEYEAKFVTEFGAIFKEPNRYDTLPTDGFKEATGCDFAYTSKSGDYTVFITGRLYGNKLYLTDAYRKQAETNEWMHRLKECPNPFAFIGGQEKGITQLLRQQGINLKTANATTDKLARAQPIAAAWNRGDVLVPNTAPWVDEVLPEVLAFTGNDKVDTHDDTIDALSSLYHALVQAPQPRARII